VGSGWGLRTLSENIYDQNQLFLPSTLQTLFDCVIVILMKVYRSPYFEVTVIKQEDKSLIIYRDGYISNILTSMLYFDDDILLPTLREYEAMAKLYGLL